MFSCNFICNLYFGLKKRAWIINNKLIKIKQFDHNQAEPSNNYCSHNADDQRFCSQAFNIPEIGTESNPDHAHKNQEFPGGLEKNYSLRRKKTFDSTDSHTNTASSPKI